MGTEHKCTAQIPEEMLGRAVDFWMTYRNMSGVESSGCIYLAGRTGGCYVNKEILLVTLQAMSLFEG